VALRPATFVDKPRTTSPAQRPLQPTWASQIEASRVMRDRARPRTACLDAPRRPAPPGRRGASPLSADNPSFDWLGSHCRPVSNRSIGSSAFQPPLDGHTSVPWSTTGVSRGSDVKNMRPPKGPDLGGLTKASPLRISDATQASLEKRTAAHPDRLTGTVRSVVSARRFEMRWRVGRRRACGRPTHPNALSNQFVVRRRAAGVPVGSIYISRHTSATLALEAGVPLNVVAGRLGDRPETVLAA
jgi:hypothetical protein